MLRTAAMVAPFRYARFTLEDYTPDQELMRAVDQAPCITCGLFRTTAQQQGWTEEHLVTLCHGNIDEPTRTIERLLETNPADTVFPYACLIDLYHRITRLL